MDLTSTRIRKASDFIRSHAQDPLTLSAVAAQVGLSAFHFSRRFKAVLGLTPKQFLEACRLESLKTELRTQPSVTAAIYQSGFGSGSRVYERVNSRLGMTPAQYRNGGRKVAISHVTIESPLGRMMIGATDRGLCFLQFAATDDELLGMLRAEYPAAELDRMRQPYPSHFSTWMAGLDDYLKGQQTSLDLPLDVVATAFQMKVWRYLQSIPYGAVQSYSDIANALGQPNAARAVARACATNPVALVIPCHRVIRNSGDLAGYRWGLDRKRQLLQRERTCT